MADRALHPVQPVRLCLPARHDPPDTCHRSRNEGRSGRLHRQSGDGCQRPAIPHRGCAARLHRLRQLRPGLPGQGKSPDHEAVRVPAGAGAAVGLRDVPVAQNQPDEQRDRQRQPVRNAAARVLRRLRRLRRNALCQTDHPVVRRPDDDRQCHRLFLDLGRQRSLDALHQEPSRPGTGLGQLAVRRQRRVWLRHVPRRQAIPPASGGRHHGGDGAAGEQRAEIGL